MRRRHAVVHTAPGRANSGAGQQSPDFSVFLSKISGHCGNSLGPARGTVSALCRLRAVTFASPAVLKVALNQRVQPFVAACLTADSPLMYAKAASLISATIGAYAWLVFHAQTPVTVLLAAAALALALVGIGFNVQHDGNHGTFSRRPWLNRLAGFTLDLIGASSYFWKDKHNDNHHIYTNIPNEDADIQLGPMARLSADHPWYWWHRYQHFYLWALYTCVHLRYLYSDVQRLAFGKNDGLTAGYPKGADMAWLLGGKAFFLTMAFAVPLGRHDPGAVITVYLLISMTMGLIFSVVFQLAHTVDVVEHPTDPARAAQRVGRPPGGDHGQLRHRQPAGHVPARRAQPPAGASPVPPRGARALSGAVTHGARGVRRARHPVPGEPDGARRAALALPLRPPDGRQAGLTWFAHVQLPPEGAERAGAVTRCLGAACRT